MKPIFLVLKSNPSEVLSVAIEDLGNLAIPGLIEHPVDDGDDFRFELADLGDG